MNRFEKSTLCTFIIVVSVKPMTLIQFVLAMLALVMFIYGDKIIGTKDE